MARAIDKLRHEFLCLAATHVLLVSILRAGTELARTPQKVQSASSHKLSVKPSLLSQRLELRQSLQMR